MHRSSTSEKSTIDGSSLEDEAFSPSAPSHPRFSRRGSGKMTSDGDGEGDDDGDGDGEGDDGHALGSLPPPEGEAPRLGLHWEQIGRVAQAQIAGCSQSSPSSISSR